MNKAGQMEGRDSCSLMSAGAAGASRILLGAAVGQAGVNRIALIPPPKGGFKVLERIFLEVRKA